TQAKNAQEAHEAIRPTDMHRQPNEVARHLDDDQRRLYELIWKRAVASQMATALIDQVGVDITSPAGDVVLRATGSTVAFNGYLRLYSEDVDDAEEDEENRRLPSLKERDALDRGEIKPEQHFTQPPPRYSEASLVKKLEELGIGRPSTYASIIQVLQDRNYVRIDKKRFIPEDRGRLVTAFLAQFFERYVEYDFTADLENQLDDISGGRVAWKKVLEDFWRDFSIAIGGTKDLKISDVINALDETLGQHFFPAAVEGGKDPRVCPVCGAGRLGLKLGRFGAFIGCSNYPECKFTRPLGIENADGPESSSPRELGVDPETKVPITLKKGPYGFYVQRGEGNPDEKPKRASIPKTIPVGDVDLDKALRLLALPRELGPHPEDGEIIVAAIGRFGPYLKHGKEFRSLPKDDDILSIGLNRAVSLLAEPKPQRRGMPTPIKSLGPHPSDGEPINIFSGRYGPYVAHGGVNATIRDVQPEELTVEQAIALLAARPQPKGKKSAAPKAKAPKKAKEAQDATAPAETKAPKQKAAAKGAAAPKTTNGKKNTPKPKGEAAKKKKAAGRKASPEEG
ncbi:MAG TPA: DNA topoisomerase, partial [Stellaceae bacterium]|nr:DNA topoisomerase [Stellaceae bacterium]